MPRKRKRNKKGEIFCSRNLHYVSRDDFAITRDGKLFSWCRPCTRDYKREWEHKNRPGRGKKRYYHEYRIKVLEAYGGKCMECGETDPVVLQVDHKDHELAKRQKKKLGFSSGIRLYSLIIKSNYPDDYQLLCANCNIRKKCDRMGYRNYYLESKLGDQ